ncbi:MAG TPA: aldo/keto reductase [Cyclobacteriaceae bacterium]|nr:aldo/keto reductase [Cyclobacteriaceae bacterium]
MNRRKTLTNLASLTAIPFLSNFIVNQSNQTLLQRSIPSTGEKLPAVGVGTWQTFNVGAGDEARKPLKEVLVKMLEAGAKVIEDALFQRVKGKELPAWASELGCKSWAQFFLKFILSHPAVTCAIPGTSKISHLMDNLGAAMGKFPDEKLRNKMKQVI